MFHSSRIRTAVAVLAAASTVATVAGPIASAAHARPNDHRYQRSSEARRKQQQDYCHNLQLTFQNWGTMILNDLLDGRNADAAKDIQSQTDTLNNAKKAGCGWAMRVQPTPRPGLQTTSTAGASAVR